MALDPTLRLLFDFERQQSLNPLFGLGRPFALTRTQDGYSSYFDADGVLRYATVDEPRYGRNPATGAFGLLVEPARTNLMLWSNDYTAANHVKTNASVTAEAGIGPDKNPSMMRLQDTAGGGVGVVSLRQTISVADATTYSYFVIGKQDQLKHLNLLVSVAASNPSAFFDLENGTIGDNANTDSTFIYPLGDGIYLCGLTYTTTVESGVNFVRIYAADGNSDTSVDLDGTSSILIGGSQFEAGALPTSLIPTQGTAQNRGADLTAISIMDWMHDHQGTFHVEYEAPNIPASNLSAFTSSASSGGNRSSLGSNSSGNAYGLVITLVGNDAVIIGSALAENERVRLSMAFAHNDTKMSHNGETAVADTTVDLPWSTPQINLFLGSSAGAVAPMYIQQLRYYDVPKSTAFVESLAAGNEPYGNPFGAPIPSSVAMPEALRNEAHVASHLSGMIVE